MRGEQAEKNKTLENLQAAFVFVLEYIQSTDMVADYLARGVSHIKYETFNNLVS